MVLRVLAQLEALSAEGKLCVILASNSLQRREILRKNLFGPKIVVEVLPSNFKEDFNKVDYVGKANRYVTEYADQKAQDVIKQLCERHSTESYQLDQLIVVIAADTVVELDGNILEKPGSEGQAVQMLLSLSDRTHKVVSGVHIALLRLIEGALTTVHCTSFHEESIVTFDFVSAERAQAYVATGEPLNKVNLLCHLSWY